MIFINFKNKNGKEINEIDNGHENKINQDLAKKYYEEEVNARKNNEKIINNILQQKERLKAAH